MDATPPRWVLTTEWHFAAPDPDTSMCGQDIPPAVPRHPDWHTGTPTDTTPVCRTCSMFATPAADLTPSQRAAYKALRRTQRGTYHRLPPDQRSLYAKRQASRARVAALADAERAKRSIIHVSTSVRTVPGGLPGHGKRY